MNTFFKKVALAATVASLIGCGSSGGGDSDSPNIGPAPTPEPTPNNAPMGSVSVLDIRSDTNGDTLIDLIAADAAGTVLNNLALGHFSTGVGTLALDGTPLTVDSTVTPGSYSVVALLDQSGSIGDNDPADLRLEGIKLAYDNLTGSSEIHTIAFAGSATQDRSDPETLPEQFFNVSNGFATSVDAAAVDQLDNWENGGSPVYAAVTYGIDQVQAGANIAKNVVVLSDGANDNGDLLEDVLTASTTFNVPVNVIGLNVAPADEASLIALATNVEGGSYTVINDGGIVSAMVALNDYLETLDPTVVNTNRSFYTLRVVGGGTAGSFDVSIGGELIKVPYSVTP